MDDPENADVILAGVLLCVMAAWYLARVARRKRRARRG